MIYPNAFAVSSNADLGLGAILTGKLPKVSINEGLADSIQKALGKRGYRTAFFGSWTREENLEGFDHWQILADPRQIYNPKFISKNGSETIEGHSTDVIADITIRWLEEQRKDDRPLLTVVYFNGAQKPWVPPIRHLEFLDDHLLPEPPSFRSDHALKAPASRYQEMQLDANLDMTKDLFLEIDTQDPGDKSPEGFVPLNQLNDEQISAWQLALRPQNEAFARSVLENEEILPLKYQRFAKNYLRCIRAIDENVGRIYDFAHQPQNHRNTQFVYTACIGSFLGENGWFGNSWIYEPSLRVPLIASGFELKGSNQELINSLDLFPKLLSFYPLLKDDDATAGEQDGPEGNNRVLYYEHDDFPALSMVAKHYGIRTATHKLIHYHQFDEWELFDLTNDPLERENLYFNQENSDLALSLKGILIAKRIQLGLGELLEPMPEEWRRIYRGPNARKKEKNSSSE